MSNFKILWLNHRDIFHQQAGGAERTIYEVSKRLVERDYEVILLSTSSSRLPLHQKTKGVDLYRFGGNITSHFKNLLYERQFKQQTVAIDDLAHVVPWLSERLTTLPGTAFFRHLHQRTLNGQQSTFKASILKLIEKQYPRLYKKWTFVTESKQGILDLQELGLPSVRTLRIPPGVDLKRMRPSEKYETPTLVYFGGMREYKRPNECLYLVQKLKVIYPRVKLKVSGTGPALQKMKILTERLGLADNIEYMGRLDPDTLFDIVSKSWLNLHFSVSEGWGYSILEAAACGTPTLAYSVPGVSEAIASGENGETVVDLNRDRLLEKAVEMIDHYEKWNFSSRRFSERYSWDTTTDKWEKHLSSLL